MRNNIERMGKFGEEKKRKRGEGVQLDILKRIRKEMPPASKIQKDKSNENRRINNWRDYLEEE